MARRLATREHTPGEHAAPSPDRVETSGENEGAPPNLCAVSGLYDVAEGDWVGGGLSATDEELGEWFEQHFATTIRSLGVAGHHVLAVSCCFARDLAREELYPVLRSKLAEALNVQQPAGEQLAERQRLQLSVRAAHLTGDRISDYDNIHIAERRRSAAGGGQTERLTPLEAVAQTTEVCQRRAVAFRAYQEETRRELGALFQALAGAPLESLTQKQEVVDAIRESLQRSLLWVACPTCGEPAMLDCTAAGRSKSGWFMFRHGARTHTSSGKAFPLLTLTDAPAKRYPKSRKKTPRN